MKNNKIIVTSIDETTFEDGTSWLTYEVEGRTAYEISDKLTSCSVEKVQKHIDEKMVDTTVLTKKIDIKNCSELLADIVDECRGSENEMWFVEEDEVTAEEVEKLEKEIKALGLEDYIKTWEDGGAITVYGGAITKFLF